MKYLKRMKIHGFKKFATFDIEFNKDTNILIGDNESGKSTILDAINLVLTQKYKNYDKYIVKELLNMDLVSKFKMDSKIENLPFIQIDLELQLDDVPNDGLYWGMTHGFEKNKNFFGIRFQCKIPDDIIAELMPLIELGQIPYEYYQMTWNTFQGDSYNTLRKPLNFLLIDNDDIDSNNSYNYYNKSLFVSNHDKGLQSKIKSEFRNKINNVFSDLPMNDVNDHQKFGVNEKRMIFENIITILDDDIPIENKGKGRENIIKTQIALDKKIGKIDILAIEEPENHLSFTNLKQMISEIKKQEGKQLIITTHESMIANSLNLKNILWIKETKAESLKNISKDDSDFFLKTSDNNMLQYILSNKVVLVEGPTEYMLIPKIFKKLYNKSIEDCGITIIDCGGVKYKRYLDIASKTNKKVAIITDNDKKQSNLDYKNAFNITSNNIKIYMDDSLENWTWETCFYNLNKSKLENMIYVEEDADYLFHGNDYGKVLGKMLNNKVDTAYQMYKTDFDFEIPKYIKESLKWISK